MWEADYFSVDLSTFYCILESIGIVPSGSYSLYVIPNPPSLSVHFANMEIRTQRIGVARPRPKTGSSQVKVTVCFSSSHAVLRIKSRNERK